MTRRTTDDPLLRLFIDRYHLHLLAIPRDGASVGDVYVEGQGNVSAPGRIEHVLTPSFALPDIRRGERLADITGQVTRRVDVRSAANILENILAGLGLPAALSTSAALMRSSGVGFRFHDVFRDSIDIMELGQRLPDHRLQTTNAAIVSHDRMYVVTAALSTSGISVELDRGIGADLGGELRAAVGSGRASVSVQRSDTIALTADRRLAFAVELHELQFEGANMRPRLKKTAVPVSVRGEHRMVRERVMPAMIGGPSGRLFLPPL